MAFNNPDLLVSIIIPTYNRDWIVGKAIESALAQTSINKQIIVVDDGSTDNTKKLVQSYDGVEYVFQENGGQAKARNNGLIYAKGSYIVSLDSDDTWEPTFLEKCIAVLEEKQLDFVFANWLQIDPDKQFDSLSALPYLEKHIKKNEYNWIMLDNSALREIYLRHDPSPSSSMVIRRSSMCGGWDETIKIGDDWCLLLDMILFRKIKAAFTLEILWAKYTHESNIFDGRDFIDIAHAFAINDMNIVMEKYCSVLTKKELRYLKYLHTNGLYTLSVYRLVKRIDVKESFKMLKHAIKISPLLSFPIFLLTKISARSKKIIGLR